MMGTLILNLSLCMCVWLFDAIAPVLVGIREWHSDENTQPRGVELVGEGMT